MSINLSQDEIFELTGAQRLKTQTKRLREMGFTVIPRADGRPIVSRANFLLVTGGIEGEAKDSTFVPNWDSLI